MTDQGQLDLLDALDRVEAHADDAWKDAANQALWTVVRDGGLGYEFTSDDVHAVLDGLDVTTHEPRALGAIIRKAATAGWIVNTGRVDKTKRAVAHKRPATVWRVVREQAAA